MFFPPEKWALLNGGEHGAGKYVGELLDLFVQLRPEFSVKLDRHNGLPAFGLASQAEVADIDPALRHDFGDGSNGSGRVPVQHNKRGVLAGETDLHTIDAGDEDVAAANTAPAEGDRFAGRVCEGDLRGVGMRAFKLAGEDRHRKALFFCCFQRKTKADIIGFHAEDPGHDRAVCTVSLIGFGEGSVEHNFGFCRRCAKERTGDEPDSGGSRSVGAGGTYHDGAQNIKYIHSLILM